MIAVLATLWIAGALALAVLALAYAATVPLMRRREPDPPDSPAHHDLPGEEVQFFSRDGLPLGGWWIPAAGDARGPGGAIDTIDAPLDGLRGDPARGRRIVTNRQKGLCLLCHPGPFPEERFQGDLAPDLAGVGARLSEGQLRARVVDARRANPATIMPAYRRSAGFERVGGAWAGRALLEPQEVEDVVAFLATLRDVPAGAGR